MKPENQKTLFLFFWLGLCAFVVLLYWPSLNSPFVYDDKIEVIGNRTIRDLSNWKAIAGYNPSRVILQFTYAFNLHQSQPDPFDPSVYHITNLVIHCLSIGAALWMCLALHPLVHDKKSFPFFALVVTALWSIHPMGSESVIYITGRSESLCALFSFLTIGTWAQSLHTTTHSLLWKVAGFLCMLLACTTKEVGLMLPFVLIALERTCTEKWEWKAHIPFALIIFGGISMRIIGLMQDDQDLSDIAQKFIPRESDRSMPTQIRTQAEVWLRYIGLWAVPVKQTIYHHIQDRSGQSITDYAGILGWITGLIVGWRLTRNYPLSRFALIAGALLLMPSSSFAPLRENMAEHRAHQWGLFLILALCGFQATKKHLLLLCILLLPLGYATHQRNLVWKTEIGLWKEALDYSPQEAEAWYGYGQALYFGKQVNEAKQAFTQCVMLDKNYLDGWISLGITRAMTNDVKGATTAWQTVLRQKPPKTWQYFHCKAHNNLGMLAAQQQQWKLAKSELHSTLNICPDDLLAHYALGELYYDPLFDKKKAIYYYERLLHLDPTFDRAEEVRKKLLKLTW